MRTLNPNCASAIIRTQRPRCSEIRRQALPFTHIFAIERGVFFPAMNPEGFAGKP
jgi:hypothetical protein